MKKRNARSKGSQSLMKRNFKSSALMNTKQKKHPRRTNPFRNPLSRFTRVGGVSVIDIGVAGFTLLLVQGVSAVLPGDPSSWLKIAEEIGLTILANKVAPQSVKTAATIGAGAVPAVALINKLTGNAIGGFINRAAQGLVPAPQPAAAAAQPPPGLAGVPNYSPRVVSLVR